MDGEPVGHAHLGAGGEGVGDGDGADVDPAGGHGHHDGGHGHGLLRSVFAPHRHDPAGSVDDELRTSRAGTRALALSLAGLASTGGLQAAVAAFSGSVSLLADTIHNLADACTAIPLGIAFWLGRRAPNDRYTYGYGRAEDLAGVAVLVAVAASAVLAGVEAVLRLLHPHPVGHLALVAAAGGIGFAGNELVASYRIRIGRRIGSAALEADGYHARTDGLTSLAVVAGAGGVALGWRDADPVLGLAITVAIVAAARGSAREIYRRLMDAVDPALVARIAEVLGAVPGLDGVEAVRLRWIGHGLHAEVEVAAAGSLSLDDAHAIGEQARHLLLHEIRRLTGVTVHTSPAERAGSDPHGLTAHHFASRPARRPTGPDPAPD